MLALTADPLNPTSILAALITLVGVVYAAHRSFKAQKATAAAQVEANQITRESAEWRRAQDELERLSAELEILRARAIAAEAREEELRRRWRADVDRWDRDLEQERIENRRLRVDLAAIVAVVRDEITKAAYASAYADSDAPPEPIQLPPMEEHS